MQSLEAQVKNGRLVLAAPTDLPEGELVELVPLDEVLAAGGDYLDDEERAALHESLRDSLHATPTRSASIGVAPAPRAHGLRAVRSASAHGAGPFRGARILGAHGANGFRTDLDRSCTWGGPRSAPSEPSIPRAGAFLLDREPVRSMCRPVPDRSGTRLLHVQPRSDGPKPVRSMCRPVPDRFEARLLHVQERS